MEEILKAVFLFVATIIFVSMISLLIAFPVMWCWNYAIVAIWKLPTITWGQSWCLLFMAQAFIKGSSSK